jgi:hypothetical protein
MCSNAGIFGCLLSLKTNLEQHVDWGPGKLYSRFGFLLFLELHLDLMGILFTFASTIIRQNWCWSILIFSAGAFRSVFTTFFPSYWLVHGISQRSMRIPNKLGIIG